MEEDTNFEEYRINEDKVTIIDQVILATLWVLLRKEIQGNLGDFGKDLTVPIDTWAGALPDVFLKGRTDIEAEIVEGIRGNCVGFLKNRNPELTTCLVVQNGCLTLKPSGKILAMLSAGKLGVYDVDLNSI